MSSNWLFWLFNAPAYQQSDEQITFDRPASPTSPDSTTSSQGVTPVFLTPQSIATFPGASVVVNLIWNVSSVIYPPLSQVKAVPIIAALFVGAIIYSQSVTETMNRKEKVIAIFIAILNSLWLACVSLGINAGSPPTPQN